MSTHIILWRLIKFRDVDPNQHMLSDISSRFPCTDNLMWYIIKNGLNSIVLKHVYSYTYVYVFERYVRVKNISFSWLTPPSFASIPGIFSKKSQLTSILQQKNSQ